MREIRVSARATYITASALFLILAMGFGSGAFVTMVPELQGLHGPVGETAALPFLLLFFLGALTLAALVCNSLSVLSGRAVLVGVLPLVTVGALVVWGLASLS